MAWFGAFLNIVSETNSVIPTNSIITEAVIVLQNCVAFLLKYITEVM